MSWLKQSATDTQITHGARLWLYVVAVLVMVAKRLLRKHLLM